MPEPKNEQQEPLEHKPALVTRGAASQGAKYLAKKAGYGKWAARGIGLGAAVALEFAENPDETVKKIVLLVILIFIFFIVITVMMFMLLFGGEDSGKGATGCTPSASQSATAGGSLTQDAAAQQLASAGITFTSSGGCTDKNTLGCTSLEGIKQGTINGIIDFKQKSGATFIITGAAETAGHSTEGQYTHGNGYKVDIGSNGIDQVSMYIKSNFTRDGDRPGSHGGPRYKDAEGNEYVYETNHGHWDILYYGNDSAPADPPAPPAGQDPVQGGGGEFGGGGASGTFTCPEDVAATPDNCNGKYASDIAKNYLLPKNFGDPQCELITEEDRSKIHTLLKQLDPANADRWFIKIIPCESSYNPNTWNPNSPDPQGAWGLIQMGSGKPPGGGGPGLNGPLDNGDINWQTQLSNGVAYNQRIRGSFQYWECDRR